MARLQRRVEENDTVWEGRLETVKQQHKEQARTHTPHSLHVDHRGHVQSDSIRVTEVTLVVASRLLHLTSVSLVCACGLSESQSNSLCVLLCVLCDVV